MKHLLLSGRAALASALVLLLAGCGSSTAPRLDASFGRAVDTLRLQQTLNPQAGKSTDPVAGIDGQTGRGIIQGYQESFARPAATGSSSAPLGETRP